jgi:hypothetical protein
MLSFLKSISGDHDDQKHLNIGSDYDIRRYMRDRHHRTG